MLERRQHQRARLLGRKRVLRTRVGGRGAPPPDPEEILSAGAAVLDPDQRVIAMLGARSAALRGNTVATAPRSLSRI